MTASALSNWAADQALQLLLRSSTVYLAAHTSNPSPLGLLSSEVAGGGYIRQSIRFAPPAGKGAISTTPFTFPGMPACIVTWFGVWTQVTNGQLIFLVDVTAHPIHVLESGALMGAAGDIGILL